MRVLVVIPHYFAPEAGGAHGSERADAAEFRTAALAATIAGLRQHLGPRQWRADARVILRQEIETPHGPIPGKSAVTLARANQPHRASLLDIVVVTTGGRHLVNRLALPPGWFTTTEVEAPPRELGFACHEVLAARAGDYDWLCYIEDDVIVTDPLFLAKIAFVERSTAGGAVLMPNRFELLRGRRIEKLYVDGPAGDTFTAAWQDITIARRQLVHFLDGAIEIERASNPHAGCFFLSRRQFEHWRSRPWFGNRDAGFVGPLESAASLGIMRCFRVYKPSLACAGFLEAEHRNNREWLGFAP